RLIGHLSGHRAPVTSSRFSPDGHLIVTASEDHTAILWSAETGRRQLTLDGHTAAVEQAIFSADGRRVLTRSKDRSARVWDVETGYELAVLRGHTGDLTSATFSHDGNSVMTTSTDGTAKIYDVRVAALAESYFAAACELLRYQPEFDQVRKDCEPVLKSA